MYGGQMSPISNILDHLIAEGPQLVTAGMATYIHGQTCQYADACMEMIRCRCEKEMRGPEMQVLSLITYGIV